jgi:uncharacterized membrane protein YbhN (UPF0104 family)
VGWLPYFVIRSLGGDVDFFKTLAQTFLVTLASGVMPTPGASAHPKVRFTVCFRNRCRKVISFWAVLLWRMLIFYLPLVLGVVVLIIEWIKGKDSGDAGRKRNQLASHKNHQ